MRLLTFVSTMLVLLLALALSAKTAESDKARQERKVNFDNIKAGDLPKGWKADATNPEGDLARWEVVADEKAPSKPNVLSITRIPDTSVGHFNVFWTKDIQFKDGALDVRIRADSGKQDQGGGLIWRAVDARNYYLARYNPLETNFRLYCVKDGKRVQIADAHALNIGTRQWFTMKIVVSGEKMEGYLDGKKLLEASDKTFTGAGGVGLWSKADAASSFDNFDAEPA